MSPSLRATNRFGLGAKPGEPSTLADPRGWLRAQLTGRPPQPPPVDGASPRELAAALGDLRRAGRDQAARTAARRALTAITVGEGVASLTARVAGDRPFVERLVAFWSNHFCVAINARFLVGPLAGAYEREAIRPHVLGKFEDMVLATARHPAMLVYLDNTQSIGPNSPVVERTTRARGVGAARERGLNENYARELLELHTVGVDGGYSQRDVTELARILTGWTADGLDGTGRPGFRFFPARHEPGTKTVLGTRYREGEDGGVRVIRDLARHRSTARFIATKLARHFVSDEPPARAVDALARVFRDSEGDLGAVSAALIELPECWDEAHVKLRPPQDWLVAALRALGVPAADAGTLAALRQLRQPLWAPPSPKGFGDLQSEWADPDSLLNRAELARTLVRRRPGGGGTGAGMGRGVGRGRMADAGGAGDGLVADPTSLAALMDLPADDPLPALLADGSIPRPDRVALAIAGPAFQWR